LTNTAICQLSTRQSVPGYCRWTPDRRGPLLREPGVVDVQDRVRVGQRVEGDAAEFGQHGPVGPRPGGEERLEVAARPAGHDLGDVLGVPPVPTAEQPLDEPAGVAAVLVPPEQRGEPVEEPIEFGLEAE
jgi:hypothetical protein